MQNYSDEIHINMERKMFDKRLAMLIKSVVGYKGNIVYDSTKPDGTPRKLLDVSRLHASGWKHKTSLKEGIEKVYQWYLNR